MWKWYDLMPLLIGLEEVFGLTRDQVIGFLEYIAGEMLEAEGFSAREVQPGQLEEGDLIWDCGTNSVMLGSYPAIGLVFDEEHEEVEFKAKLVSLLTRKAAELATRKALQAV